MKKIQCLSIKSILITANLSSYNQMDFCFLAQIFLFRRNVSIQYFEAKKTKSANEAYQILRF